MKVIQSDLTLSKQNIDYNKLYIVIIGDKHYSKRLANALSMIDKEIQYLVYGEKENSIPNWIRSGAYKIIKISIVR